MSTTAAVTFAMPYAVPPAVSNAVPPALGLTLVERDTLLGASLLGLVPVALAGLVVLVTWWRGRDEMFDDITRHPRARNGRTRGPMAPTCRSATPFVTSPTCPPGPPTR